MLSMNRARTAGWVLMLLVVSCAPRRQTQTLPVAQGACPSETVSQLPPGAPDPEDLLRNWPELPAEKPVAEPVGQLFDLDLREGDIRDVLLALLRHSGKGLVLDPGVTGRVPLMEVRGMSLERILQTLLPPLGLTWRWEGENLRVAPQPLQTRFFSLDYLAAKRRGQRQVSFSTRSGMNGSSSGGSGTSSQGGMTGTSGMDASGGGQGGMMGGGQNTSSSELSLAYENRIWESVCDGLEILLFGRKKEEGASAGSGATVAQSGGGMGVQTGLSRGDDQGRYLVISPQTGMVVVRAREEELGRVARFLEEVEGASHRQVWIEARIIEVNLNKGYQMGIDWAKVIQGGGFHGILGGRRTIPDPGMTFTPGAVESQALGSGTAGLFQYAVSNGDVDLLLEGISRQGSMRVLSSPRISTMNNEKAVIRVVREEAFFSQQTQISQGQGGNVTAPTIDVQVVPVGIIMDILPQVNERGDIILSINPDISELLEVRRFEVSGASATQPVIDRRSMDTVARLHDGQTLVLAGIIKEKKSEGIRGVPFVYKLPLLGNLFRRTEQLMERTELVILITPKVVSGRKAFDLTREERDRVERVGWPVHLGDGLDWKEGWREEWPFRRKKAEPLQEGVVGRNGS